MTNDERHYQAHLAGLAAANASGLPFKSIAWDCVYDSAYWKRYYELD